LRHSLQSKFKAQDLEMRKLGEEVISLENHDGGSK
jgi:hypothetical protein